MTTSGWIANMATYASKRGSSVATIAKGEYVLILCIRVRVVYTLLKLFFFFKIFPQQTYMYKKYRSIIFYKYLGAISRSVYSYSFVYLCYANVLFRGVIANRDSFY